MFWNQGGTITTLVKDMINTENAATPVLEDFVGIESCGRDRDAWAARLRSRLLR